MTIPTFDLFFDEKTLKGCMYGSGQVRRDFPRFIDLIETGRLDTGAMVSKTIKLDEVNDAFTAMEKGEVIRSVITSFYDATRSQASRRKACSEGAIVMGSRLTMWPGLHARLSNPTRSCT